MEDRVSVPVSDADEEEAYQIGKRDGYEEAIQDLDLATGGDGEYKATSHDGVIDMPVMKARIIERFSARPVSLGGGDLGPSAARIPTEQASEGVIVLQTPRGPIDVDASIAPLVAALNAAGFETIASCSGHGHRPGNIALRDGRELIIARNFTEGRHIDALFPVDASGAAVMWACKSCNSPRAVDPCPKCGTALTKPADGWTWPGLPDIERIRALAREVGYAVGVHGTMERDLDLIAAPWVAEAVPPLGSRRRSEHKGATPMNTPTTGAEPVAWVSGTALARLAESERGCETVNLWKSPPTTDAQPLYTAPAVETGDRERVARIVDPLAYATWESAGFAKMPASEQRNVAYSLHIAQSKADAILAALQKGEGR